MSVNNLGLEGFITLPLTDSGSGSWATGPYRSRLFSGFYCEILDNDLGGGVFWDTTIVRSGFPKRWILGNTVNVYDTDKRLDVSIITNAFGVPVSGSLRFELKAEDYSPYSVVPIVSGFGANYHQFTVQCSTNKTSGGQIGNLLVSPRFDIVATCPRLSGNLCSAIQVNASQYLLNWGVAAKVLIERTSDGVNFETVVNGYIGTSYLDTLPVSATYYPVYRIYAICTAGSDEWISVDIELHPQRAFPGTAMRHSRIGR